MKRGERLNNPGNIRHVYGVTWLGQSPVQTDEAFVQFKDPKYGIRAIARILHSYELRGLQTIGEAIDRWAPPNENNSAAYVADVCNRCSLLPDEPVDFEAIMPQLTTAIIWHEQGRCIYTAAQIAEGISLA